MARAADARAEDGFLTAQYLVAIMVVMAFLVLLANLIVFQYGRGIVRTAVDEGARAGARVTSSAAAAQQVCLDTAAAVRADLLGGSLGDDVAIACRPAGETMTASADVTFTPWLAYLPPWRFTVVASARQEVAP